MCLALCSTGGHFATVSDDGIGNVWADDNDWHTLMGVHLHGAFTVVRAAWPHFKEQDHGRIVLTGSSAGLYGQNLQAGCKTAAPAAAAAASGS